MGEMPIPSFPFEVVGMDLIGPFVESEKGNKYALVVIDHLSGWPEAIPIPSKSAADVQRAWQEDLVARHGCPSVVVTDQGREFKNNQLAGGLEQLGWSTEPLLLCTPKVMVRQKGRTGPSKWRLKRLLAINQGSGRQFCLLPYLP